MGVQARTVMSILQRVRPVWTIVREAASEWMEDNATRLSAALAFYTILSVAPLLLIVVAVAGWVFGAEAATERLQEQARSFVGDAGAEVFKTTVEHANRPSTGVLATVIGIATLLFGASGVFGELQGMMNVVWNVKSRPGRGIWGTIRARFVSFGMVLAVGFILLVSLVITAALAAMGGYLNDLVPGLPTMMYIANFVVSFEVVTVLFGLIFKVLPDAKIAWKDVWFGALMTALLFTVGKYLIGLYLGKAGVATPFGAAGSVVAFVVWVYYSGLILFFGAELTQVKARHAGRGIIPTENAMVVDGSKAETRGSSQIATQAKNGRGSIGREVSASLFAHSAAAIFASGFVASRCSAMIFSITVRGTARSIPVRPQSVPQKASAKRMITGLKPTALPMIAGSMTDADTT